MTGEGSSTLAYHAGLHDLFDDLFRGVGYFCDQLFTAVDGFHPLITFYPDIDGSMLVAAAVHYRVYLSYLTRHRRMDVSRNKTLMYGNDLTCFHHITPFHHNFWRSADMLINGDSYTAGQGQLFNSRFCGKLIVIGVYTTFMEGF